MKHVAIWIDHNEAKVFDVEADEVARTIIHSVGSHVHRKPKDQEVRTRNHPDDEQHFFREVVHALEGRGGQILLVGPSQTKLHFMRFVHSHDPKLESRIVGVETVDHPTDAQLVAHLRHYFHESPARRGAQT